MDIKEATGRSNDKLRYEYGQGIVDEIIKTFKSYNLDFEWSVGWNDYDKIVYVSHNYFDDRIRIRLVGENDNIIEDMSDDDIEAIKNMITSIIDKYKTDHPYENIIQSTQHLITLEPPYDMTVKTDVKEDGDGSHNEVLRISIELVETKNKKAKPPQPDFAGDTFDDVAQGIGKFQAQNTFEIAYCPAGVDDSGYCDKFEADKYKRLKINIKYMRVGLSYADGFKYWDRFQKIKGLKKVAGSSNNNYLTSLRLAAEYVPNPNIMLVWASNIGTWDNIGILMERSEFDKMIADLKQLTGVA